MAELHTGIDLPGMPIGALRRALRAALAAQRHGRPLVVYGCAHGAALAPLAAPDVTWFSLECTGMLPPSFVEYALHDGAAGVLVTGCRPGGCEYRLGQQWTAERLRGQREPYLRTTVPAERLEVVWADAGEAAPGGALAQALARLRQRVLRLPEPSRPEAEPHHA